MCQAIATLVMISNTCSGITRVACPPGASQLVTFSAVHGVSFTAGSLSFIGLSSFRYLSSYSPEFGLYFQQHKAALIQPRIQVLCSHAHSERPTKSNACINWLACDTQSAPCLSWFLFSSLLDCAGIYPTSSFHSMNKNTRQALRVNT